MNSFRRPMMRGTSFPFLGRLFFLLVLSAGLTVLVLGAAADNEDGIGFDLIAPGPAAPRGEIVLEGLSPDWLQRLSAREITNQEWQNCFSLRVASPGSENGAEVPPILGRYHIRDGAIVFEPRFPLSERMTYQARFTPEKLPLQVATLERSAKPIEMLFSIPETASDRRTVVTEVYPTQDRLPANQLKFYVHFSAAMREGNAYREIYLLDSSGDRLPQPFVEVLPEMWSNQSRRLTLLFHPGRIKRGLEYGERVGLPLQMGESYELVVAETMRDSRGELLLEEYRKEFQVIPADRTSPDPGDWKIIPPLAGTQDPLLVELNESMDHALLSRMLTVEGPNLDPVLGVTRVSNGERRWAFIPAQSWESGEHRLVVNLTIEDLAGNQIGRLFDEDRQTQTATDIQALTQTQTATETQTRPRRIPNPVSTRIPFQIKAR